MPTFPFVVQGSIICIMFHGALNSSPDHFSGELRIKLPAIELLVFLCCLRFSVSDVPGLKKVLPNSHKALQGVAVTFNLSLSPCFSGCLLNNSSFLYFICSFSYTPPAEEKWLKLWHLTLQYLCSLNRGVSRDQIPAHQLHKCDPKPGDISELCRSSLSEQVFVAQHRKRDLG